MLLGLPQHCFLEEEAWGGIIFFKIYDLNLNYQLFK